VQVRLFMPKIQRIALLTRSLGYGGTEMQLTALANGLAGLGTDVSLLVFYPGGPLEARLSAAVKLYCMEKRSRWDVAGFLRSFSRILDQEQPQVLYSFLPVPNLIATWIKFRSSKLKVAWGVRTSDIDLTNHYDWLSRVSYWLERRFSRLPNLIIANSQAGRRYAVSRGFPDKDRFIVIPNGIDTERFRPDVRLRVAVRADWGVLPEETLIGIVARLDPLKDYPNFLKAAALLAQSKRDVRFVSVGSGPEEYTKELHEQARALGLSDKMIWAGSRADLPAVYNALDLMASASLGEGFSNVLGEAMACGIPCIATDVGDAREILGDDRAVVPPSDPEALADGFARMRKRIDFEGESLRAKLRQRITDNFSVGRLVERTKAALEAMA
jgi:glycosyltransferase involved in cell wall biosynthesis